MNDTPMTVTFPIAFSGQRPAPKPKPDPLVMAERLRQNRAERRARQLALAYHIDNLIRSEQVADLATMARLCSISRARVSKIVELLGLANADQERILTAGANGSAPSDSWHSPRPHQQSQTKETSNEQKAREPDRQGA